MRNNGIVPATSMNSPTFLGVSGRNSFVGVCASTYRSTLNIVNPKPINDNDVRTPASMVRSAAKTVRSTASLSLNFSSSGLIPFSSIVSPGGGSNHDVNRSFVVSRRVEGRVRGGIAFQTTRPPTLVPFSHSISDQCTRLPAANPLLKLLKDLVEREARRLLPRRVVLERRQKLTDKLLCRH